MRFYEPRHDAQTPEAPHQHDDAWQGLLGAYLKLRFGMQAPEMFEVLCKCEHDDVTRARYVKLAREAMPWWQWGP